MAAGSVSVSFAEDSALNPLGAWLFCLPLLGGGPAERGCGRVVSAGREGREGVQSPAWTVLGVFRHVLSLRVSWARDGSGVLV